MSNSWPPRSGGFRPGVRVRVVGGTFVGHEGRIMGPDEASARGMHAFEDPFSAEWTHNVMLSIFGRDVPVQLDGHDIDYA
jgi:transcription antitermination factor NusG